MNVEPITDKQLYALNNNPLFRGALRDEISAEYGRRDFSDQYADELNSDYKQLLPGDANLTVQGKILTVLTAYVFPINSWVAIYLSKGSQIMQKQFWNWLTLGYVLWSVLIIVLLYSFAR